MDTAEKRADARKCRERPVVGTTWHEIPEDVRVWARDKACEALVDAERRAESNVSLVKQGGKADVKFLRYVLRILRTSR